MCHINFYNIEGRQIRRYEEKRGMKLDFIPNRLNKYSIRKFTVGTASILVGATLLFGIGEEANEQ